MKRYIYTLIIILLYACGQSVVPKPERLLSEKEMENLMYDLAIIDAIRNVDHQLLDSLNVSPSEFIYQKHNIDSLSMVENMVYYASFPKKYDKIIKNVEARLKKERDELSKPKTNESENTAKGTAQPVELLKELESVND